MKAILVPVGGKPRQIEAEGFKGLQEAVGGYVESCSWIFGNEPAVYVNEDGKVLGLEPNWAIYATAEDAGCIAWRTGKAVEEGDLLDIIVGDFVCVGIDPETGECRDITEAEAEKVMQRFGTRKSIESGMAEAVRLVRMARGL